MTRTVKSAPLRQTWTRWPKTRLLNTRICDLGLTLEKSMVAKSIRQLYRELQKKGLDFTPHFWLSDEWYCPDDIPGISVPFFLGHPKLAEIERDFMLEVEGEKEHDRMKLLRHETGHALANAFQLHERRDWKRLFGRPSTPYPDVYLPRPYSKRFVVHLPNWYAQSHPHEDWAETFAVWLTPNFDWRHRYRNWPALKKLEYVDTLIAELSNKRPRRRNKRTVLPVEKMRMTIAQYYEEKIARYKEDRPDFFDRDLKKIFSCEKEFKNNEKASHYIRRCKPELIEVVERWTSEYRYRINEVLKEMKKRCDELDLRVTRGDDEMKADMVACLTMLVMNKLHSDGFHMSL